MKVNKLFIFILSWLSRNKILASKLQDPYRNIKSNVQYKQLIKQLDYIRIGLYSQIKKDLQNAFSNLCTFIFSEKELKEVTDVSILSNNKVIFLN